jgi:hypothetical protein
MSEYEFTLTFVLPAWSGDMDVVVERLGESGCTDATVGIGRWGRLALSFVREGETAGASLRSALTDVRTAVPGARLLEASPDLVGLSDVAVLLGVSRQNVRKLILACDAPAPAPVHEGRPTIWRLAKVLAWLRDEKRYGVPPELMEVAVATMQANLAVQARDIDRDAQRELSGLLA